MPTSMIWRMAHSVSGDFGLSESPEAATCLLGTMLAEPNSTRFISKQWNEMYFAPRSGVVLNRGLYSACSSLLGTAA